MVKHTTTAIIQSVLGLGAVVANAGLQAYSLSLLHSSKLPQSADIKEAKQLLLASVITQFVAVAIMITTLILVLVYRDKFEAHMSKFIYGALLLAGLLLVVGGALGTTVAMRLQCYRSDPNIHRAWQLINISAVIGVLGAVLLLLIQVFTKCEHVKEYGAQRLEDIAKGIRGRRDDLREFGARRADDLAGGAEGMGRRFRDLAGDIRGRPRDVEMGDFRF